MQSTYMPHITTHTNIHYSHQFLPNVDGTLQTRSLSISVEIYFNLNRSIIIIINQPTDQPNKQTTKQTTKQTVAVTTASIVVSIRVSSWSWVVGGTAKNDGWKWGKQKNQINKQVNQTPM